MKHLVKSAKSALLLILPVIMLLVAFSPVVLADNNWVIEDDRVYIDNEDFYLSATPATLRGSGWVEFEIRSKGYAGELDLVWGVSGVESDVSFDKAQSWQDNVGHNKERFKEEEKRLELVLDGVLSAVPADVKSQFQHGNTSGKNDTLVEFTLEGQEEEFELGGFNGKGKVENRELSVKCDYYSLVGNKAIVYYYEMVETVERYTEYYPDYDYLATVEGIEHTSSHIEGADKWTVQELDEPVVIGETYKARCYIEMPFTGLDGEVVKYVYGVKPHNKSIEQAELDGVLWLIDPWLDPTWEQRVELTIDHNDVDADLVNFPVAINISTSAGITSADVSFIFDELTADANRKKIAVTTDDEVTECYVEIEEWDDASEQAWLHVEVPAVSSTVDTTLYLYFDVGHADNDAYVGDTNDAVAENVWDANFKAVYHMADGVDNAHIYDSTSNDNDGTKKGANEPVQVAGMVGKAQDFDGSDDFIQKTNDAGFAFTDAVTLEAIINFADESRYRGIISKVSYFPWSLRLRKNGSLFLDVTTSAGRKTTPDEGGLAHSTSHHVAGTYDKDGGADNCISYANGASYATATHTGTLNVVNGSLKIGWVYTTDFFLGTIDEVRISDIARSASWIKATKEGLWDSLVTLELRKSQKAFLEQ